jgi:hypothetical protein
MLTPVERERLEARLEKEPALRDRLEGLRWTVEALGDLPEVALPRNFILSPSMVSVPKPAARSRRRWTWPALGWATAVAMLLFLFVVAGDLFVVAPSLRQEPLVGALSGEQPAADSDSRALSGATQAASEAEGAVEEAEMVPLAGEAPAEEMAEATVAAEAPAAKVAEDGIESTEEPAMSLAVTALPPMAEKEQAPPLAVEATDEMARSAGPVTEGLQMSITQEFRGTPSYAAPFTPTLQVDTAVVATASPPAAEPEEEPPLVVSPPPDREPTVGEGEQVVQPQTATATPAPVAAAPLAEERAAAGPQTVTKGVPLWLRVLEIGLGLVVVGLAAATLIVRRRQA